MRLSNQTDTNTIGHLQLIEIGWWGWIEIGVMQLKSLAHLELVVNCNIIFPVKVGHGDIQRVIFFTGQTVESPKPKPDLSPKRFD